MKVFINPGHHPGVDSGAVNSDYGVEEASIAKNIGALIEKYLHKAGIDTESLQSDNLAGDNPAYPEVCATANASGADLFVSIHCNSFSDPSAKGTETLVYSMGGEAEKAARAIQRQLVKTLKTVNRGVKERPGLIVLNSTTMPAVLVEVAFISNQRDVQLLMYKQDDIARAIARGITDYLSIGEGSD